MIDPVRLNGPVHAPRRSERAREASSTSYARQASAGGPAPQTAPTQPMAQLSTLVAIQAVEERRAAQRRATRRGTAILDDLDALKLAILEGRAGEGELDRMARTVESAREETGDEELDTLVDAIELRAKVEMAKRQR